jgi:hypothetical protein
MRLAGFTSVELEALACHPRFLFGSTHRLLILSVLGLERGNIEDWFMEIQAGIYGCKDKWDGESKQSSVSYFLSVFSFRQYKRTEIEWW